MLQLQLFKTLTDMKDSITKNSYVGEEQEKGRGGIICYNRDFG